MPGLSANIQPVKMRFSEPSSWCFVDLDECRRLRLFGGRSRIAGARRDLERAERCRLAELDLERRDTRRHLVECRKDGDLVLDALRVGAQRRRRQYPDDESRSRTNRQNTTSPRSQSEALCKTETLFQSQFH